MNKVEKTLQLKYKIIAESNELTSLEREGLHKAETASNNAYAPYSKFRVGAAVLLEDKTWAFGSNQENRAYPSGMCAERVALNHVGSNFPDQKVDSLFITAKGDFLDAEKFITPCGACRQVILETIHRQKADFKLYMKNQRGEVLYISNASSLMPWSFGEK